MNLLKKYTLNTFILFFVFGYSFAIDVNIVTISSYNDITALKIQGEYLWIGTKNKGVIKLDKLGNEILVLDQIINCRAICIDLFGNKWFADESGLTEYSNGTVTSYANEINNSYVNVIDSDILGNIWIGTNNGVFMYDGSEWIHFDETTNFKINSLVIDADLNITVGTQSGTILQNTNGTWTTYSNDSLSTLPYINALIGVGHKKYCIAIDQNAYICSKTSFQKIQVPSQIHTIATDENKNYWFGTDNGIYLFENDVFSKFSLGDSRANDSIKSIAIDIDGTKWIVSSTGLSFMEDGGPGPYIPENDKECSIYDFTISGNELTIYFDRNIKILQTDENFISLKYNDDRLIQNNSVEIVGAFLDNESLNALHLLFSKELTTQEAFSINLLEGGIETTNGISINHY
ncbi:MAG: hypothetical protein IPO21_14975 [Bacteroidales bacterium]|nr:hypothetical protein [Bacteroidales bacterium]